MSTAVVIAFGAVLAGLALVVIGGAAARASRGDDAQDMDPMADPGYRAAASLPVERPPSMAARSPATPGAATDAAAATSASTPAAPARDLSGRLRILVIDDEPLVGQMIERLLASHHTTAVTSGEAALSLLATDDSFDVILCDFMMPGLSGTKLAGVITERHRRMHSRIVFMSSTPDAQRLLYRSELRWVAKPARYEQLAMCIIDVVASASQADEAPSPELAAVGT